MPDTTETSMGSLYTTVLREAESDTIQELPANLYLAFSSHLGDLKRAKYDNIEAKIKEELVEMTVGLVGLLLRLRLGKASTGGSAGHHNLLDEEKYIIDSADEMQERQKMILSAILNGKSKLLESMSERHKTRLIAVRFLKEIDQFVGADLEGYGPFAAEDVASIPYENAQALISQEIAAKIRWED